MLVMIIVCVTNKYLGLLCCFQELCLALVSYSSSSVFIDFLKSLLSCLFSICWTKDFSNLIAANFSDPKSGRWASTNQRSPGFPLGPNSQTMCNEKWLEVKFNMGSLQKPWRSFKGHWISPFGDQFNIQTSFGLFFAHPILSIFV